MRVTLLIGLVLVFSIYGETFEEAFHYQCSYMNFENYPIEFSQDLIIVYASCCLEDGEILEPIYILGYLFDIMQWAPERVRIYASNGYLEMPGEKVREFWGIIQGERVDNEWMLSPELIFHFF